MQHFSSQKGFTLVEMVLYVAICSLFLVSSSYFLSFLMESKVRSQVMNEVNQQGVQITTLLTRTIRGARSIDVPLVGTASTTLSLTVVDGTRSPTVFTSSSSVFTIREGGKSSVALTNHRIVVTDLLFQNVSASSSLEKIVRFSFVLRYATTSSSNATYEYSKTFSGSAIVR